MAVGWKPTSDLPPAIAGATMTDGLPRPGADGPAGIAAAAQTDPAAGVAVAVVGGRAAEGTATVGGADPVDETSLFEIASISKTMTALVLAQLVMAGVVELSTPLGDVLDAGANGSITLRDLATHTSGLPRLPANLVERLDALAPSEQLDDPYATYTPLDLETALRGAATGGRSTEYSNFGYMVLAHALSAAADRDFADLLQDLVFDPIGMTTATIAPPREVHGLVPGYRDGCRVPHWTKLVPGPGGVLASITDLMAFLSAQLEPAATDLEIAIEMTQAVGPDNECLGWQRYGDVRWHNGGSGGFSTFTGFDRPNGRGVAILHNCGLANATVDRVGFVSLGLEDPLVDA